MSNTANETSAIHPFERCGLGKAPYDFVGIREDRVGTSCDYCCNGIKLVATVRSADGKKFKVGTDCVQRCDTHGSRLQRTVKAKASAIRTKARKAREAVRIAAAVDAIAARRDAIAALPHPRGRAGESLADWAEWMLANAGHAGKLRVAKTIEAALAEKEG